MTPEQDGDWARLGKMVRERREELRLSQAEVQTRGGPSDTIQSRIENNDDRYQRPRGSTLRMLDAPLRWQDGSAVSILAGGDPVEADHPPDQPPHEGIDLDFVSDSELIDELRRRLTKRNDGKEWPPGWGGAGPDARVRRREYS